MKVHIYPEFAGVDNGDGGVRRVVEAQHAHLPYFGIDPVEDPADASVLACHITIPDAHLRRFGDTPIVAHCHGLYWSDYQWMDWAYKANDQVAHLIRVADVVTAPSEWVAQIIRRHWSRDVRVVPHGVDTDAWKPIEENGGYVLWNKTRVDPVCDDEPIKVLPRMMPNNTFVTTYGQPSSNCLVTGRLPYDKAKLAVERAGVYLCTTRETFGIGTLEAMACGVPIVGYKYGGQVDFVEEDVTGYLVEPGDIEGLQRAIDNALNDRERLSANCRRVAVQYSWQKAMAQYAQIYREVEEKYDHRGPRTSIIVTAYKLEKYLPDCLKSVLAQTDEDWECVVVDDASPDACGKIADSFAYKDSRFHVIHNEENQYLAQARNIGITEARGRFILPLDADDKLPPKAVEILADALDSDRSIDIAYGNVYFTGEDGKTPVDYGVKNRKPGHSGWPVAPDPSKQIAGFNLQPYSSMYRRRVWELTGGYRRRLKTAEDADFWTRAASYGFTSKLLEQDTLIYRNREGSMSRKYDNQRLNYLRWYPWAADPALAPAGVLGARHVRLLDPKISVIIPVGPGHERYVIDAVDSVSAQSFLNWEIIVVNDTGGTLQLPPYVRVVDVDVRDPAAARNIGVGMATADLYVPLDADDYMQPDALQWMASAYTLSGGDIIYPDFLEDVDADGQALPTGEFRHYELPDYDCAKLVSKGALHAVTALTPVEVWHKVGGYREGIGWEDWDFQMRCAVAGYCSRRLAAPLFVYRKATGQRARYDKDEFNRREQEMRASWNDYYTGAKQLACGCSGNTISPRAQQVQHPQAAAAPPPDAVRIQYTGPRSGAIRYKGSSGMIYSFSANEPPKWVLGQDVELFQRLSDFRIVTDAPAEGVLV